MFSRSENVVLHALQSADLQGLQKKFHKSVDLLSAGPIMRPPKQYRGMQNSFWKAKGRGEILSMNELLC